MNVEQILKAQGGPSLGPPTDIPASELLQKLQSVERPSELVPFPRNDADGKPLFQYRCRILTQSEIDQAVANAERHARQVLKEGSASLTDEQIAHVRKEAWEEIYNNAKCVELIYASARDPSNNLPLFATAAQIRKLLTADEAAAMFHAYTAVQFKLGPQWRVLSASEIEEWIDALTTGVGVYPLAHLEPGPLAQLAHSLAYHLRALKTGTGSAGSHTYASQNDTSQSPELTNTTEVIE